MWRGKYGDPIPLFGPLSGRRHENQLVYEWASPEAIRPWTEVILPDGRLTPGGGSAHGDEHTRYVDLVPVEESEEGCVVRDLFADVIVPSDGRHAWLLDLDELADAVDRRERGILNGKGQVVRPCGSSDSEDGDVRVSRSQQTHVVGVMRRDHSAAEPHRRRDDEGVDRHLTSCVGLCEEVAGDPGDANTCRDDLRNPPRQNTVDHLVSSSPPVELDEHC